MLRIFGLFAILMFAGSILVLNEGRAPAIERPFAIHARPIALDIRDPDRQVIGGLRYLDGWVLSSDDDDFGGISAIAFEGDGFVAIGDAGGVFRFGFDGEGRIDRAAITVLPAGPAPRDGRVLQKSDRDAESLAYDPASGIYWVGFERANGIWRYDTGFTASDANRAPEEMSDWPFNSGAEAMVRLADGRFLVFSENGAGPGGSHEALVFEGDPTGDVEAVSFGYRPPNGFRITDAAQLPDGRLVILNRRFTITEGVSVIVSIADIGSLTEGSIIESSPLATFRPPLTIDNMEALAIREEEGRTVLWIASDDNFNALQRTLLLRFALIDE